MANFKIFAASIVIIAAGTFMSCEKEVLPESSSYRAQQVYIIKQNEKIVDRKADDARIDLNTNETFIFDENILVENEKGEQDWREGESFTYVRPFAAFGEKVDTVYTDATNFTASLVSRQGSENIWSDGNWAGTQVDSTYHWSISNGEYTFNFATVSSASDAVYTGEGYEVAFPMLNRTVRAELNKAEKVTVLNGKTYKETDFVHTSEYVFTVPAGFGSDSKTIELENKLVVLDLQSNLSNTIENENYLLNLVVDGNKAYASEQKNSWDVVVYDYETEVSREEASVDLNLEAEASKPAVITVAKADLGKLTLRTLTHGANKTSKQTDGDITKTATELDYVATFNGGNAVTISTLAESAVRGDKSLKSAKIQNVRFIGAEVSSQSDANAVLDLKFDVDFETPEVATKAASNVVTRTITVAQEQVANDELVRRWGEGEANANGNNIDVIAKFYEEWSVSGTKLANTQTGTMTATLNGQNGEDVVANNANFTTGNGQQNNGTYSSTASNGEKSFTNNYTYTCDNSKTFTYEGVEVKFEGTFVISEVSTTIANSSVKFVNNIAYDVYPYNNKVQGVYTVGNKTISLNAETSRNILVERVVPKVIPESWGKILSMGVSAVPAHAIGNGFADGAGTQAAHKCFTLVCENGAVATVTAMGTLMPSTDSIVNGNYVEGNFNGCTSGVDLNKNGIWYPAKVVEGSNLIQYFYNGQLKRSLTEKSMSTWSWRNGNYTAVVDGYDFAVSESGILTVSYNGEVLMQIR